MIVRTYHLYTVYYIQRCSRSGSFFPTPTLWAPGFLIRVFWIISAMSTLLVRHCQLMLNWWFVARWFGFRLDPRNWNPLMKFGRFGCSYKNSFFGLPQKKNTGPQNHQFTILIDFIVDQDLTNKKKMDTFIPEPLGSSDPGRKADLKNPSPGRNPQKNPPRSSGTWISSPGRFTASCNKWAGIGSCARISSSPAFRGRFRFLGGGRDSKKWEKGWKSLKRCSFLWNYKGLQRVGSSF